MPLVTLDQPVSRTTGPSCVTPGAGPPGPLMGDAPLSFHSVASAFSNVVPSPRSLARSCSGTRRTR